MSHERGSVPAPEGSDYTLLAPLLRLGRRIRRHVTEWPRRYVEMRTGRQP